VTPEPSRLDPRAIAIGAIVDNLATLGLTALLGAMPSIGGMSDPEWLLLAFACAGLLSTVAGGIVAARIARMAEVRNGAGVGALALVVGLLSQVSPEAELPGWYLVSAFALVVPAGMLGGFLGRRRHPPR
jgi:putative membrane protein (TIGR04086 family)